MYKFSTKVGYQSGVMSVLTVPIHPRPIGKVLRSPIGQLAIFWHNRNVTTLLLPPDTIFWHNQNVTTLLASRYDGPVGRLPNPSVQLQVLTRN